jgi:hypothetical protein
MTLEGRGEMFKFTKSSSIRLWQKPAKIAARRCIKSVGLGIFEAKTFEDGANS